MRRRYLPSDLKILDSLEFISAHPERFLQNGSASGPALASDLVFDLLVILSCGIATRRYDDWWIISAEADWIIGTDPLAPENPLDVFRQMWPFPKAGVNSIHNEVVITAFATDVITATADSIDVIKGELNDDFRQYVVSIRPVAGRLVAFRL